LLKTADSAEELLVTVGELWQMAEYLACELAPFKVTFMEVEIPPKLGVLLSAQKMALY